MANPHVIVLELWQTQFWKLDSSGLRGTLSVPHCVVKMPFSEGKPLFLKIPSVGILRATGSHSRPLSLHLRCSA